MFCANCAHAVSEGDSFCPNCGASKNPTGGAMPNSAVPAFGNPQAAPAGPQQTSGLAIASLICSLLPFFLVTPIIGVILGHVALSQIKKSGGRLKGSGLAIAGLVLGYCCFVPLIIAALAIPNLLHARIAANEASAAADVRALATAEVSYSTERPESGYTCSLNDLRDSFNNPALVSGSRNGYMFELQGCSAETAGGPNTKFQVIAYPITKGTTGQKSFCTGEDLVVRYESSGSAQACVEKGIVIGQ
jgi:type IV pilus assembly protein PilA